MGGVMIKAGQFLSSRVDMLPPEITEELAGLQDEVPPFPGKQARSIAEAALEQAQARLDELVRGPRSELITAARANVAGAEDELAFRQSDYERVQRVHARNLASPELLDQAKAALDAATASLRFQRAQLQELLSGTTVEELTQAEAAVKQAAARRDQLAVDVSRHEIRAPVDGIVDTRVFELGERPAPGQVLMIVLPGSQAHTAVFLSSPWPTIVRYGMRPCG